MIRFRTSFHPPIALRPLIALLASIGTVSAFGQTTPAQSNDAQQAATTLDAVTVTAPTERPQIFTGGQVARKGALGLLGERDFLDTPFSTTRYTAQVIQDQQATSIAEVLTGNDPSVRAAIGSSNRYDAFTIRGFRVPNSDVALNGLYGLLPNFRISPDAFERVDLIKGPSAMLSGIAPGGSVGGGINAITKRADDAPLTRTTMEFASDSRKGLHLDLGRRFGEHDEFGVRLNASQREGKPPYDGQSARSTSISLGLDYRGERLRVSGDLIYQNDWMRAPERGYNVLGGIPVPGVPSPRANISQSYDFSDTQSTTVLSRAEYDITPQLMAFAAAGINRFDFDKRESPGGSIIASNGNATTVSTAQQGDYRTFTGEVGLRARLIAGETSHEVTLVANRLHQKYRLGQERPPASAG